MTTRLRFRGYIAGQLHIDESADVDADEPTMQEIAERHARTLLALPGGESHMIEIELLDEPNRAERFFRIGTDPSQMAHPIAITESEDQPDRWAGYAPQGRTQ